MFIIENEGIELQKLGVGKALQIRFKNWQLFKLSFVIIFTKLSLLIFILKNFLFVIKILIIFNKRLISYWVSIFYLTDIKFFREQYTMLLYFDTIA